MFHVEQLCFAVYFDLKLGFRYGARHVPQF